MSRMPSGGRETVKLPVFPRPRILVIFLVVVLFVGGAGYAGGALLTARTPVVPNSINVRIPVTAIVENRVVAQDQTVQGSVQAGTTVDVVPPAPSGTSAAVVVSSDVKAGDQVTSGKLLGIISNRPLFLLTTTIPLFRDLYSGDQGADVSALQAGLTSAGIPTAISGKLGSGTLSSIRKLYARSGQVPPGFPGVPYLAMAEIVTMPSPSASVISSASVGDVITKDLPFVSLQVSPNVVTARVTVLQQKAFAPGTKIKLTSSGYSGDGTVQSISGFRAASDTVSTGGYDVVIPFATAPGAKLPPVSAPVTLSSSTGAAPSLAIPTIALRQDSKGTYLVAAAHGGSKTSTRIPVTVGKQADGWSAISGEGLVAGLKVLIQ